MDRQVNQRWRNPPLIFECFLLFSTKNFQPFDLCNTDQCGMILLYANINKLCHATARKIVSVWMPSCRTSWLLFIHLWQDVKYCLQERLNECVKLNLASKVNEFLFSAAGIAMVSSVLPRSVFCLDQVSRKFQDSLTLLFLVVLDQRGHRRSVSCSTWRRKMMSVSMWCDDLCQLRKVGIFHFDDTVYSKLVSFLVYSVSRLYHIMQAWVQV